MHSTSEHASVIAYFPQRPENRSPMIAHFLSLPPHLSFPHTNKSNKPVPPEDVCEKDRQEQSEDGARRPHGGLRGDLEGSDLRHRLLQEIRMTLLQVKLLSSSYLKELFVNIYVYGERRASQGSYDMFFDMFIISSIKRTDEIIVDV
jgi:hypothetical protein